MIVGSSVKLILEQRYLFDGSVGAIGHHGAHVDAHDPLHPETHAAPVRSEEVPGPASPPMAHEPATAAASNITTVLIVDPSVTNWQSLVTGVKPGVDVVLLDPAKDGITQVTRALSGLTGVKNLEFLTDGTPGAVTLAGSTLDMATLTARAPEIAAWSASLSTHADIAFWGCDVAQGSAGAAFVADMHTLTGATIGGSSDATGSATLGGNWNLEVTTGHLHDDLLPFAKAAVAAYSGVLDTPDPVVSLSATGTLPHTAAGTILLGDTINVTMSFTNPAMNATGYGPFVELFAPAALTMAGTPTSSGSSIATLSATIAVDGSFTNPLTHATETAPGGIVSGSVYFLELPYGSFTPGEPAVGINASFTMSNDSALVGTTLPIEARAGFRYGAVATGGTPVIGTTVGSSETVALIESWLTVGTQPGEGETATGPDFPVQYTLNIEPAPAITATNTPIRNLSLSLVLPDEIIETGPATASGGGVATITGTPATGGTEQTLTVNYASLPATETVGFSAYVPQVYRSSDGSHVAGTPILDPSTGAPVAITVSPAYTFAADAWNAVPVGGTGDVSGATFDAKSLAVQLVESTATALPTQDIGYTLKFEVSDYFGVQGLNLGAVLGNGLTFDPTVLPLLTVSGKNGGVSVSNAAFDITANTETTTQFADPVSNSTSTSETVQAGGNGPFMTYAFDGGTSGTTPTGQTALSFNVGGLLPGQYGAGSSGSVAFAATVLDRYPTAVDQVSGAGGFLRESDPVGTSSATSADFATGLYDYAGGTYTVTANPISDNTATQTASLPEGSYALAVKYVNGVAFTGQTIAPGDTVVYEMTYSLASPGDFAGLNLTAYVPEPVFSVLHPGTPDATTAGDFAGTGSSAFNYNATPAAALSSGQYTYSLSSGLAGVSVTGGVGVEPSNSVSFSLSAPGNKTYYNAAPGTGATETVTIDFAVTASHQPFADGLHLTAQGDSNYTPAVAPVIAAQATRTVLLNEPSLLQVEQGVVSVVNGSGSDVSGTSGIVWTMGGAAANAPTLFAAAGSPGVFAAGATVPSVATPAQDNLDVAGAQAGDTVRIADVVQNAGHYAAYDVILKDALSQAFTTGDVSKLTFTRGDGTVLETIDPKTGAVVTGATAINDYFSTGLLLAVPGANPTATPTMTATGSAGDIVYVTYDVKLPPLTPTGAALTGEATLVAWTNQDLYVPNGSGYTLTLPVYGTDGNFADDPAIGAALTDTATVVTLAPAITDTITGAVDASAPTAGIPGNTFSTHNATVVPGETVSLNATITLPQGVNTQVEPIDILPAGLTLLTGPGTYTATYTDNTGHSTDITAQVGFNGNKLTLPPTDYTVTPTSSGGDAPGTITISYKAIVPGSGAAIDTSGWGTNPGSHDTTLTDSFAATNEGISYTKATETNLATTTATANASGVANTVTVTNPQVTSTITELPNPAVTLGQNVYSGEPITYQLTLTNSSTSATAYDLGSTLGLPAGLTYVPGSLVQTGGSAAQDVTTGNVGSNGASGSGNAVDGITLAPGATSVFTFRATVNDNLTAGTALTVAAKPAWESLPANATFDSAGKVNPQAQPYSGAPGNVSNSVGIITPDLSIVGESNATAGLGTAFDPNGRTQPAEVTATDSEIVRMREVLQIPEGQNSNIALTATLPAGLTYQNDGSTKVLLVSPNGDVITTLTGTGLQVAAGSTAVNLNALGLGLGATDPVSARLDAGAISVSGQTVTFNIGGLANNDHMPQANYIVVEFNAVVVDGTAGGTPLVSAMNATANSSSVSTLHDYVKVVAPDVALTKLVDDIVYNPDGTVTVTYTDTATNTGSGPAYNVRLTDPGAGVGSVIYRGTSGGNAVTSASGNGSEFDLVVASLPATNGTQSFTYTVTIPASQITTAVSDATATAVVTWNALTPAHETAGQETLAGTTLTPPVYVATATAGLDVVSGTVNQDLANTVGAGNPLVGLPSQQVTVTFPGQTGTESTTTDGTGHFVVLVPGDGQPVAIAVTPTTPNAPAGDALDNGPALAIQIPGWVASGVNPLAPVVTLVPNLTPGNLVFNFWSPHDTAPVLAGATPGTLPEQAGSPVVPFPTATVSDAELDGNFAHDFSGTTLTLQRYVGAVATPDANDLFTGTGTPTQGVSLSNGTSGSGNVLLAGATVGTYIEANGVLTVKFAATGVSANTVDAVLNGIAYIFSPAGNPLVPGAVIGAQIDDANNDPVALNGNAVDPGGPHDQGPGGDMLSNVLTTTIDVRAAASSTTFFEPNDASPAAAAVSVDPAIDLSSVAHTVGAPSQVTLSIANVRPEDVLTFTNTADITGTYSNGTLTLNPVAGHTPTLGAWQAAIRSVQYYDFK